MVKYAFNDDGSVTITMDMDTAVATRIALALNPNIGHRYDLSTLVWHALHDITDFARKHGEWSNDG